MANVKNGSFREGIIDRCLRNRRGFSTQEMFEKCNDALERRGEPPITSMNTIRNDINSIQSRWKVVVELIKDGREKRYRYQDRHFSIYNTPLTEDEIAQLSQSVSLLKRFEGMPGFGWVEELSAHLQTSVNACPEPVIGFDENKCLKGKSFFSPLFKSIISKNTIKIKYKNYKTDCLIETVIHPYYLKEFNQRWFLFALNEELNAISNFALDRIESIERSKIKYISNNRIDFSHYFDNIVGVSLDSDKSVEEIKLWVDKEQLPYTLSKPIHQSQKLKEKQKDGSGIITINVIPNFELIQSLLSYGDRIEVLSPESIRKEICERIRKNLQKYK